MLVYFYTSSGLKFIVVGSQLQDEQSSILATGVCCMWHILWMHIMSLHTFGFFLLSSLC